MARLPRYAAPGMAQHVIQRGNNRSVMFAAPADYRTGTLWEGRFRATLVEPEQCFLTCHRYIELNPVRAGLATSPGDYSWSSYRATAFGTYDALVTPHECYLALGADPRERQAAHRAQVEDGMSDSTLDEIRGATNGGWVLVRKRFREEIAALLGRRTQAATRGRRPRGYDEIRL